MGALARSLTMSDPSLKSESKVAGAAAAVVADAASVAANSESSKEVVAGWAPSKSNGSDISRAV